LKKQGKKREKRKKKTYRTRDRKKEAYILNKNKTKKNGRKEGE